MIIKLIFWISLICILHSYLFYPLLLSIISLFKKKPAATAPSGNVPFVSVLMAVHNEESVIDKKIRSLYYSDYKTDKIEVFIGSDFSDDNTNKILSDLAIEFPTLSVVYNKQRKGKPSTINHLATLAQGEIFIITDANVFPEKNAIRILSQCFSDPSVGLADSRLVATGTGNDGISLPEKTYSNLETRVKNLEGKLWGTMMGPSGGCYAVRRDLFEPVPGNFLVDDFFICMNVLMKGKKAISDLSAVVYESVSDNLSEEFQRKTRIAAGDFQNLKYFKKVLSNPFSKISFSFVSHKVLRWLTPFLYFVMLITNALLTIDSIFFILLFILQLIFLLLPALDIVLQRFRINIVPLRFITHFYVMNIALMAGFIKNSKGVSSSIWEPTKRHL